MPPKIPENVLFSQESQQADMPGAVTSFLTAPQRLLIKSSPIFFQQFFSLNMFLFPQICAVENIALINKAHTLFNSMCKKRYLISEAFPSHSQQIFC